MPKYLCRFGNKETPATRSRGVLFDSFLIERINAHQFGPCSSTINVYAFARRFLKNNAPPYHCPRDLQEPASAMPGNISARYITAEFT